MTKEHYTKSTPIDQSEIIDSNPDKEIQFFEELIQKAIQKEAELSENITFLTGALSCTKKLEDKSKIPEALELCIDLLRDIYQQVEENRKVLNLFKTE